MTSIDYIKDRLSQILDEFPEVGCKYEFDEFSFSHIIEISPSDFYLSNKNFKKIEFELLKDFIDKFPYENITFITEEDFYRIENPIFEKQPQFSFSNIPPFEFLLKQNFILSPDYLNIILNSNMVLSNDIISSLKDFETSWISPSANIVIQPLKPQKPAEVPDESSNHALAA